MQVGMAIDTLEYIAKEIRRCERPVRLGLYALFGEISRALEEVAEEVDLGTKYGEELLRYEHSLAALCGLGRGNGHDDSQHVVWLLAAADGLRSDMCFGSQLNRPE